MRTQAGSTKESLENAIEDAIAAIDRGDWTGAKMLLRVAIVSGTIRQCRRDRIFNRIRQEANGCWTWTGCFTTDARGGGKLAQARDENGRRVVVSKWLYHYQHGPASIGGGYQLHRTCDNSRCVNPDHRIVVPASKKLSPEEVARMKCDLLGADGRWGALSAIARKYGVTPALVKGIAVGRVWKDVKPSAPSERGEQ